MAGNNVVINEAALNEGGGLTLFVGAVFGATALVAAPITYVHHVDRNITADAVISSKIDQQHAAAGTPLGQATGLVGGDVQKWVSANVLGDAEILAPPKAPDGGAVFVADAAVTPISAFFNSPMSAVLAGTAEATVNDADIQYVLFAEASFDSEGTPQNPEVGSYFTADPSYLANGAVDYIHYVGWDFRRGGQANITFTTDQVRIFANDWLPFGGATFEPIETIKQRVGAAFTGESSIWADPKDQFFGDAGGVAIADFTAAPSKLSVAEVAMDAPGQIITPTPFQTHYDRPVLDASDVFIIDPNPVIRADGGYVDFVATGSKGTAEAIQTHAADTDMLAEVSIQEDSYQWTWFFDEPTLVADAQLWGFGSVWGFDVFIIERAPEVKDFVRPGETKDFIRPLS